MSFFVTRPPAPVPVTAAGSTPCSDAIRATTGETKLFPFPPAACEGAGALGAGSGAAGAGSATASGAGAGGGVSTAPSGSGAGTGVGSLGASTPAEPAGVIVASTVPTSTV
jgi:hypothetical protein